MARQNPEQTAAIAAFAAWYQEYQGSRAALEAEVADYRARRMIERDTAVNLRGVEAARLLTRTKAIKSHTATALGISRPTLDKLLSGIEAVSPSAEDATNPNAPTPQAYLHVANTDEGYVLTVRDWPAEHPPTVEATGGLLNYEDVPIKTNGLTKGRDDATLPLSWELQHDTALRRAVLAELEKEAA